MVVNFYDSSNLSLTDIMNETYNQYISENKEIDENEFENHKKHVKNTK